MTRLKNSKIDHKSRDMNLTIFSSRYPKSASKTALTLILSASYGENIFFMKFSSKFPAKNTEISNFQQKSWQYEYKCSFRRWFRISAWKNRQIYITWLMVDFRLFQSRHSFSIDYCVPRKIVSFEIFHFLIPEWPKLFIKIIENFSTRAQNCQRITFSKFSSQKF